MVIPQHVALILDGNGRWAKKRGLPRTMGHKEGCVTVEKTVEIAARMGIRYLTVYGFSTENWKRSADEVGALMQLFRFYMVRQLKIASANNVRVKMIGDRARFDRDIIEGINRLESETKDNTGPVSYTHLYIGFKWYYFEPEGGAMAIGWKQVGDKWYYLDPNDNGAMYTYWLDIGKDRYYLDENLSLIHI